MWNIIIGIVGLLATCFVIWQNYRHKEKPTIIIDYYPSKDTSQKNASIHLRNLGECLKITQLICIPNNLVLGLPSGYTDKWDHGETKKYVLFDDYFPIKDKFRINIIVEDSHNYQFCISLSYKGEQLIAEIKNYHNFCKRLI